MESASVKDTMGTFEGQEGSSKDLSAQSQLIVLAAAINTCARLNGKFVDRLRLHHAIGKHEEMLSATDNSNWQKNLMNVALDLGLESIDFQDAPDVARLPSIAWLPGYGWMVVRQRTPSGEWILESQGRGVKFEVDASIPVARLIFPEQESIETSAVKSIFKKAFLRHKNTFFEAAIAGVFINLLALGTSLFSMQVYDRVVPTQGYATLGVLAVGVLIVIVFEMTFKIIRSHLVRHAVIDIDASLSRDIFSRLLDVRLDQLPSTVGSLAAQLRGYETIRIFLSASTFYLLVDAPFGLFFIILIALIGGPLVALVPLFFLVFAIAIGIVMRKAVEHHAGKATAATNMKSGLLVEAIEGAETIKSGGGGWSTLSRWLDVVDESIEHEVANRRISEKGEYFAAIFQQLSYAGLVCVGAYFAAEGELTMGALIACSILSGRALGPVAQIPLLMNQRANAKAALDGLERIFQLETDNHGVERPLTPEHIYGNFEMQRVSFAYKGSPQALMVPKLQIAQGERVGVIGPVGSGKSTLLRLLTGMYQCTEGQVLLDSLDIDHISKPLLAEKIGYLQQDHRLFQGSLRQNLLVGIPDPGDAAIRNAAAKTGLLSAISNHPSGLELMIAEGGKGLSGGQRQLVAFTRLLLSNPCVWLLDEPTASMDEQTEGVCHQVLNEVVKPEQTLVVVTHKPSLLSMVNRLIVLVGHQIVIDGPRDQVIARLNEAALRQQQSNQNSVKPDSRVSSGVEGAENSLHSGVQHV